MLAPYIADPTPAQTATISRLESSGWEFDHWKELALVCLRGDLLIAVRDGQFPNLTLEPKYITLERIGIVSNKLEFS